MTGDDARRDSERHEHQPREQQVRENQASGRRARRLERARERQDRRAAAEVARLEAHPEGPRPWQAVVTLVSLAVPLLVGRAVTELVFDRVGRPPAWVVFLVAAYFGFALAGLGAFVVGKLSGRGPRQPYFGQEILDALDRISRGDFSVRIQARERHPLSELVDSVNTMAGQLGDLERHRQEFISNVSHEIQSPLTSIGGFATLARDASLDEATRAHYLDVIAAETARLSALSDNLLRLSALDGEDVPTHPRTFRLDEQLRSVILMLEPQWTAKHLDVTLDADEVEVDADEDMLCQVWVNLVNNAIKFTPDGGHVQVGLARDGDQARCHVTDDGIGISSADLPRVFERFYRADAARTGNGNGLGLALVRRVVELVGGRVDVSSILGQGTTFTVDVPLRPR